MRRSTGSPISSELIRGASDVSVDDGDSRPEHFGAGAHEIAPQARPVPKFDADVPEPPLNRPAPLIESFGTTADRAREHGPVVPRGPVLDRLHPSSLGLEHRAARGALELDTILHRGENL